MIKFFPFFEKSRDTPGALADGTPNLARTSGLLVGWKIVCPFI
ncbi:hypothetical protein SNF32_03860 [Enterococcus mundtii]|nr:hypothetical protein [Enterococcus mundtii]